MASTRCRTDIDNMTAVAFNHAWQNGTGRKTSFAVVGVDHIFPVFNAGLMGRLKAQRQTCVVDQNINIAPFTSGGRPASLQLMHDYVRPLRGIEAVTQFLFRFLQALGDPVAITLCPFSIKRHITLTKTCGCSGY